MILVPKDPTFFGMYLSPLTVFAHVIYQNDQKTLYNQMIYFSEDNMSLNFVWGGIRIKNVKKVVYNSKIHRWKAEDY